MRFTPSHRWKALGLCCAATLTLLLACDDENLFETRSAAPPEVTAVSAPAEVRAGQTLDVRVRAVGELRIDSLVVRARGAFSDEKSVVFQPQLNDVTTDVSFEVPEEIQDTVLVVSATAVDVAGNVSAVVSDTVRVRDSTPPSVTVQASRQVVGLGKEVAISVEAQDNVGLRSLGFRLIQVFRDSLTAEVISEDTLTTELVAVTGSKRDSTFLTTIPEDIPEGSVRVEGIAEDIDGNVTVREASAALQVVFIDEAPPTVMLDTPRDGATLPTGDSLFVRVNLSDNGGITSITLAGFSRRGDPDLGTDTIVQRFVSKSATFDSAPKDTTFMRFLRPTADSTSENAFIVATAVDVQGNVSADTSRIILGGPKVDLLNVEDGQEILSGRSLAVRIHASDPQQLLSVQLEVSGAIDTVLARAFAPPVDSVTVDTAFVIPEGLTGEMTLVASARNTLDVRGESAPVLLTIVEEEGGDEIQPQGSVTATAPSRMELQDSVFVEVTGRDDTQGSGVALAGYTVLAISPSRGDTLVMTGERTFTPPRTGNVSQIFSFPPFNVDQLSLPDTLNFDITGYLIDAEGNCGAFVTDTTGVLDCGTLTVGGQTVTVAEAVAGQRLTRSIVDGKTVFLPQGGTIADAVVDPDPQRPFLILSNIDRDRLEIFDLLDEEFGRAVLVGAEPWGLAFNRFHTDTLLVANSGGTNVSRVFMASGDPNDAGRGEDVQRRIKTPNDVLTVVSLEVGQDSREFLFTYLDFSDRPQFVAHDSVGRIVYSTKPTSASTPGTIRMADQGPAGDGTPYERTEVAIFFEYALPDALSPQEDTWSFARVDSIGVGIDPETEVSGLYICDHPPGFPSQVQCTDPESLFPELLDNAMRELVPTSDAFAESGAWDVDELALTDTTFVAASGDGGWVAFGEGASSPTGRVILWNAGEPSVTRGVPVSDLVNNASERVFGVDLNDDGSLGAARGSQAYMFTNDLRLQGVADLPSGGAGIAFHPLHHNAADANTLFYEPNTHLAFAGTGDGTIDIIDTFHFFRTGRIFIRDVVVGPLRASLPFPEDNADLPAGSCDDVTASGAIRLFDDANGRVINQSNSPRCVVLKLYGVTDAGGVVVINVTKNDILRNHPANTDN